MKFQPIENQRVYEKVIHQIQDLIQSGELKRGDKLPAEREMTSALGISRASLREAYSALELVGIIETKPREGTFIRRERDSMLKPLALSFMLDEDFHHDFIELREILEVECVRLAASRRTDEDLQLLTNCLAQFNQDDRQASIAGDKLFHRYLVQSSHNSLLVQLVDSIGVVVDRHIESLRETLFSNPEDGIKLSNIHEGILHSVTEKDPKEAVRLMRSHYQFVKSKQGQ